MIRNSPPEVFRKRWSENMQQVYRRTPMPKCHFNKVATLLKLHFDMVVLLLNLLHIFRTPSIKNNSDWLLLNNDADKTQHVYLTRPNFAKFHYYR